MDYTNSKISCPVCNKKYAKNYLLTHLKTIHKNCYGTSWWDKYSEKYDKIIKDHRDMFGIHKKVINKKEVS